MGDIRGWTDGRSYKGWQEERGVWQGKGMCGDPPVGCTSKRFERKVVRDVKVSGSYVCGWRKKNVGETIQRVRGYLFVKN